VYGAGFDWIAMSETASKTENNTTAPPAAVADVRASETKPAEPAAVDTAIVPEPVISLTAEEVSGLRASAARAGENWNSYLRAVADLENYKKRAVREKQDAARAANEALLSRLIPVLDHFDMALAAANIASGPAVDSLKTGVAMVGSQLRSILAEAGLEEIDATGQTFDPQCHEAVSHQESAEVAEGSVLQQLRKGYRFHDRLLRPATVIVAKKPAA
jgi:molecular chaperone GrpE